MNDRKALIIKEDKEKIQKIKEKYNNLEMSDQTAKKIESLETTNNILNVATKIAGVLFVIDLIIPDPIVGMDEALLGGITAASQTANNIIENKINDLAASGNTQLQKEEISKLSSCITNIVNNINEKNNSRGI